jgi:thiamine pyrophosphate-dependent acetolactate synthase large subunit-like protein
MLHGAHAFDSKAMDELPELTQWLRAVVVADIKRRLGVPEDEPPLAAPTGLSISPYMGLTGTAKVSEGDLSPLG